MIDLYAKDPDTTPHERLLNDFLDGDVKPLNGLKNAYSKIPEDVLAALDALCHDACHDFSITLAERYGHDSIMLFTDDAGFPLHSGLYLELRAQVIDGEGVWTVGALKEHWRKKTKSEVINKVVTVSELSVFSEPDGDASVFLINEFERVALFLEDTPVDQLELEL